MDANLKQKRKQNTQKLKSNKQCWKVKKGGEGKPEANPNKVKTKQGKVKCNVNLKKERRITRLDLPQAWRWRQKMFAIFFSFFLLVVDVDVMCPINSPATAPENVLDSNNSVATLGLEVQSAVASVFSPQGWLEGLYQGISVFVPSGP